MATKPISTSPTTMGKHGRLHEEEAARAKGVTFGQLPAAAPKVAVGEPYPPAAPKSKDDAEVRNEQDQRAAKEAPKPTTHGLPSAPADVKPLTSAALDQIAQSVVNDKLNVRTIEAAPKPVVEAKPAKAPEPDGPMSLADVNAILADSYPGFEPTNVRGESGGLKFALPGGRSITVERARIKKCANMEELRAYIDSVK